MGRILSKNEILLKSNSSSTVSDNYIDYQKEIIQMKHDSDFDFATTKQTIQKEEIIGSRSYVDVVARVEKIIIPDKGIYVGDDYRKLLFKELDEEVVLGQKFYFSNIYWLCYNTDNILTPTVSCLIRRCNENLRWIEPDGTEYEEPCVIDYFKFSFTNNNVYFDKQMRLGTNQRFIVVQDNADTRLVHRDMRFIIDDTAWRVTNIERTTHNGLIEMTISEHQLNPVLDDTTNDIAYTELDPVETVPTGTSPYLSGDSITNFSGTYIYTVINPAVGSYTFACSDSSFIVTKLSAITCSVVCPNVAKTVNITAILGASTLTKQIENRSWF